LISPLLTDFYQLTMACGYWKLGLHEREAVFHLIYRKHPFKGNYAIACGLGSVIEFLNQWKFEKSDLDYLRSLRTPEGIAFFPDEFLDYLQNLRFTGDIDAIPEGTIAFTQEPLMRIKAPLIQGQLLESALLNIINFQTLIATKATRVCKAASPDPVFEFGLRRAQGPDGALSASRAAYIGGCVATSNVLAGKLYDIPVRGTHAHSWVTAFPDERTAFSAYAKVMPSNCTLLVDTFNTIEGVKHAIETGKKLRQEGHELLGIRLDSGDIAALSINARQLLDAAGFTKTKIIASNSLDEYVIQKMKQQGCKIDIWGAGTNLVTAYDHPALDGVYKLSALRDDKGKWVYKLKLSEQAAKISNPGIHQIRRYFSKDKAILDVIYDIESGISDPVIEYDHCMDLLVPIFKNGKIIYSPESIHQIREKTLHEVTKFTKDYPEDTYPLELDKKLQKIKQELIRLLQT